MPMPTIDLIIPARNEEANVEALLAELPRHALRHVVVVDNGSTDRTAELARQGGAVVVREARRGYGAACLAGLAWLARPEGRGDGAADGGPPDVVAFVDADLSDDPRLLPRLWAPLVEEDVDLVIASRPRLAEPGALTWPQRTGNAVACLLIRLATGVSYSDLGPMRAVRWSSLQRMAMRDTTWGWTVEMQFKAASLGMKVRELDVPYRRRRAGVSKISGSVIGSLRAGWKITTTIGRLWWTMR